MTGFRSRLKVAERLESTFIEVFNSTCTTHRIFKFGIEATNLTGAHDLCRAGFAPVG